MTELERALYAVGRGLELPDTPQLASRVRGRIERRSRMRLAVAAVLAAAVVGVGIALAVPPARSAILRFFHLGAATVERVETLPPAEQRPLAAGFGPARTRAGAEQVAGVRIALPRFEHGAPTRYYALPGLVATSFRSDGKPVLLVELAGEQLGFAKKFASPPTRIEPARVSGVFFAFWLSGGEHVVQWSTPAGRPRELATRLAGNVLIWQARGRTYRLEGELTRRQALRLAGEITP